jgi:hypothetical protein
VYITRSSEDAYAHSSVSDVHVPILLGNGDPHGRTTAGGILHLRNQEIYEKCLPHCF